MQNVCKVFDTKLSNRYRETDRCIFLTILKLLSVLHKRCLPGLRDPGSQWLSYDKTMMIPSLEVITMLPGCRLWSRHHLLDER